MLVLTCVGGVVVLHLRRPDLDPLQHVLSEYANGRFGIIMTAVFYGIRRLVQLRPDTVRQFRSLAQVVLDHWRTETTTAADGTTLHWTDTGDGGPPVVLLHGVQVDGMSWLRTARALEASHRVIMPDAWGHGRSGRVTAPVATAVLRDDMRTVLTAAGVDRPVVVGHSMGADVAGHLAAVSDVRGVVLVDPALAECPLRLRSTWTRHRRGCRPCSTPSGRSRPRHTSNA